jgi:starch synthase
VSRLRVLAVASEAAPLVKTGGLADVAGALPAALAPEGVEVTTLLPGYRGVLAKLPAGLGARPLGDLHGGPARLLSARLGAAPLLVLDAPHLYDRDGSPYTMPGGAEWPDNAIRFAAFAQTAARLAVEDGFDAVHAHDWQAGLVPAYLRYGPRRVPTLFTIHNLAFQGQFPASVFARLGLPNAAFSTAGLEYFGMVGFLKAGLWFADHLSTVSPSYAAEIRTPQAGMGLDGLLRGRGTALSGILNALDTTEWNPATDRHLAARFSADDVAPRAVNKRAVQDAFGLAPSEAPLLGFVGRLTWQKGVDLLLEALPAILGRAQLAILGTGEGGIEERCRGAAAAHPGGIGAVIGFDEALARRVYGGADILLVPSRFEPCGLAQFCALRYGAVPLVAHTGGLIDSVVDANEAALAQGWGTGLHFAPATPEALMAAIGRALALHADPLAFAQVQRNGMASDLSWSRSARAYAALLRRLAADG